MVRHDKVAHRYAKAAYDVVGGGSKARELGASLKSFADVMESSAELNRALTSDLITESQRRPVVEEVAKKLGIGGEALKILLVISSAKRLENLGAIASRLHELVLEAEGIIPIWVESAAKLGAEEAAKVEKKFATLLGKKVEATYVVDPKVVGGLRVTAGGRSYDGTLSGWLGTFQERLVGG